MSNKSVNLEKTIQLLQNDLLDLNVILNQCCPVK